MKRAFLLAACCMLPLSAFAQLRVGSWNITNWSDLDADFPQRLASLDLSVYGVFQGRTFAPDILFLQEIERSQALNQTVSRLNSAPGSPGDWVAAPWRDGPDTESALVYRTSKVRFLGVITISNGSTSGPPRNTYRYDFQPAGYPQTSATVSVYNLHMKAGSTTTDEARRLIEAQRVRDNAEGLVTDQHFMVVGDLNVGSSGDDAYVELTNSQSNNAGRSFDPIVTPGNWGTSAFRFVQTQDPWNGANSGGMDDRYDFLLCSDGLLDGEGLSYLGNPAIPYSTTTWNDPQHSYRVWGNDGSTYNAAMKITNNAMVGTTIAQALMDSLGGESGHLPLFMDMRVPGKAAVPTTVIDFGYVDQNSVVTRPVTVTNVGDTVLWGPNGVAPLLYSFSADPGVIVPIGTFAEPAGGGSGMQNITLNTTQPGRIQTTFRVLTNDELNPEFDVVVRGVVVRPLSR